MKTVLSSVRIAGISAAVPARREKIIDSDYGSPEAREKFVQSTGVAERRRSTSKQWCSDFAAAAADRLVDDLGWDRNEIGLLVFVTQSADLKLPSTACILQDRLGLGRDCAAFDVNLGCSGYNYGLQIAGGMMSARGIRKALLLVGDTSGKREFPGKKPAKPPLFGDAATATALEWDESAPPIYCDMKTDGSGWEAIHERRPGGRPGLTEEDFKFTFTSEGDAILNTHYVMKGEDVFNFSVREVPPAVQDLLAFAETRSEDVDDFVFHQANRMINEFIRKRLGLDPSKVPSTLEEFGNTSSATIPLTMVTRLGDRLRTEPMTHLLCGFGVGLSWATTLCRTDGIACPDLVEI